MGDRVIMAYEGMKTSDGRIVLDGALYWGDLPLPVFAFEGEGGGGMRNVVGRIVELERNNRGEIEALMDIEMPAGYVLSMDGGEADLVYDCYDPLVVVFRKMQIRGGTLIPLESWAWKEYHELFGDVNDE